MKEISSINETPRVLNGDSAVGDEHPYEVAEVSIYETIPTVKEVNNVQQCGGAEFDISYSMLGPEADYNEPQAATVTPPLYMHYEMVLCLQIHCIRNKIWCMFVLYRKCSIFTQRL